MSWIIKIHEQNFWATACSYYNNTVWKWEKSNRNTGAQKPNPMRTMMWTTKRIFFTGEKNLGRCSLHYTFSVWQNCYKRSLQAIEGIEFFWMSYPKWRVPWARLVKLCPFKLRFLDSNFLEKIRPTKAMLEAPYLLPLPFIIFFIPANCGSKIQIYMQNYGSK